MERVANGRRDRRRPLAFRFALDDDGSCRACWESPWRSAASCSRCPTAIRAWPSRASFIASSAVSGRSMPLMEDIDLMRRLKRSQLVMLHSRAVTSGVRYRNEGYVVRSLRNLGCMLLDFLRVPTRVLARLYG